MQLRVLKGSECQIDCHHTRKELMKKLVCNEEKKIFFHCFQFACTHHEAIAISYFN